MKNTVSKIILSPRSNEEKRQDLDILFQQDPENTILQTMKFYNDHSEFDSEWLDLLNHLPALTPAPREIHTVALFARRLYNGGIERVVANLTVILQKAGFKTILLTDEPENPLDYPVHQNLTRIILPKAPDERISFLNNVLQKYEVDLLFYHVYSDPELLGDLLTAKAAGIPAVMTFHNVFTVMICLGERKFYQFLKMTRFADKIIALSPTDAVFFNSFGVPSECVPNPMSFAGIHEEPRHQAKKEPILLFPARIAAEKNPLDIIRIFSKIRQQIPSAVLQITGKGGTDTLDRSIKAEIRKLGLTDCVQQLGFCKEMQSLYENADLMLMTSDYEGFPLTLVEAKSMALPIVAYNLPYLLAMQPGTGVATVPFHNIGAAADKAVELLRHPEIYRKYSQDALNNARYFASVDLVQEYRRIFSGLFTGQKITPDQNWKLLFDTLFQGVSVQWRNAYKAGVQDASDSITSGLTYRVGRFFTAFPVWLKNKIKGDE